MESRRHPPNWLFSKGPNYQRWRTFWMKNAAGREGHQGGLVLGRQCPGSPGTCNPEETGLPGLPVSWSTTLFSGSGPVGLPPVLWTEKTSETSPYFVRRQVHYCGGDLVGRTTFWFFFFLSNLQKLEQRAKKCIALRGECVEWIPSLVAVACFLPDRAKDLSAPLGTSWSFSNGLYWGSCSSGMWRSVTERFHTNPNFNAQYRNGFRTLSKTKGYFEWRGSTNATACQRACYLWTSGC